MIDIHCHPLPGVDDGARSFEIAVGMCRMAAEHGTTHLVATPHSNYSYTFDADVNRQLVTELQQEIGEKPKLLLGCDFHLSYDNIQLCAQHSKDFTINQTSYLLVELPDQFIPDHISRVYYEIQVAGLKPIITHPERNALLQRRPELLESGSRTVAWCRSRRSRTRAGSVPVPASSPSAFWTAGWSTSSPATPTTCARRPPILSHCYQKLEKTEARRSPNCCW